MAQVNFVHSRLLKVIAYSSLNFLLAEIGSRLSAYESKDKDSFNLKSFEFVHTEDLLSWRCEFVLKPADGP